MRKELLLSNRYELMKKKFDVDEEKKIVKLNLHYDKASDLLEEHLETKAPTFNREKFGVMKDIVSDFPVEYKADLNIKVDDYEGFTPDEMLESFDDAVDLTVISGTKAHRKKWIQITLLLIGGILVLYLLARGLLGEWMGLSETTRDVLKEVFDISAWVFVWQAVSLMFLTPTQDRMIYITLAKRIHEVYLLDKDGNILAKEKYNDTHSNEFNERRMHVVAKYLLLIAGAAFFAVGLAHLVDFGSNMVDLISNWSAYTSSDMQVSIVAIIVVMVLDFLVTGFEVIAGVAALLTFTGRAPRFQKLVIPFGSIIILSEIANLVLAIILGLLSFASVLAVVIATAYFVGAILIHVTRIKN